MIIGCDQKLRFCLTDDNTGTTALNFLLLAWRILGTKHAVIILNLLNRLGCDRNYRRHCPLSNLGYIKTSLGIGRFCICCIFGTLI